MTTHDQSDIIIIKYEADEATFEAAIKNRKDKVKLLSIAATPFQSEQHFKTVSCYHKIKSIDFFNNCTETHTNGAGVEQERGVRCATWFCIWKITDVLLLESAYTKTDENMQLKFRTMFQLNDKFVLGFLWFTNAMRHNTILKQYKCDMATVMTGTWPHTLKSQAKVTPKKGDANRIFRETSMQIQPQSTSKLQDRSGKGMHTQLVANEFFRALIDLKDDRLMMHGQQRKMLHGDHSKYKYGQYFFHPKQQIFPLAVHPTHGYIIHPGAMIVRRGERIPNVSYLRPNAKRQRVN